MKKIDGVVWLNVKDFTAINEKTASLIYNIKAKINME